MAHEERSLEEIDAAIISVLDNSVIEEEMPILLFNTLKLKVEGVLHKKINRKTLNESIGALKKEKPKKVASVEIAGRDVYFLMDLIQIYKSFKQNK